MSLQQRQLWFRIENSSTAHCIRVLMGVLQRTDSLEESAYPGLSLLETSGPLHPAVMETYKHFSHLSEKDLAIWQGWSQNVPEACIRRSPGCERRQPQSKLDYGSELERKRETQSWGLSPGTLGWEVQM